MGYRFCAYDPFGQRLVTWFMGFDWLRNVGQLTHESQMMDFKL